MTLDEKKTLLKALKAWENEVVEQAVSAERYVSRLLELQEQLYELRLLVGGRDRG